MYLYASTCACIYVYIQINIEKKPLIHTLYSKLGILNSIITDMGVMRCCANEKQSKNLC